jgi:dsRNA-specific ribonuclease
MSDKLEDVEVNEEGLLLYNPYNNKNVEITQKEVESILKSYGLPGIVYNLKLYQRAFVHKSYTKRPHVENLAQNIEIAVQPEDCLPLRQKSNERLEFLGDGILEAITKYYLYRRFPKENEGFMTEKKISLVKNEAIGKLAYDMNLNKWLLLSNHAEEKKSRTNLKKLGCLFEAFLAAVFLDYNKINIKDEDNWFDKLFVCGPGFQMAQIFIEKIYERHVNWTDLIINDDNYKNILQVKIQKEFKTTPMYIDRGYDPDTGYNMGVYLCLGYNIHEQSYNTATKYKSENKTFSEIKLLHDKGEKFFILLGEANHKIKKKAEQQACFMALDII